jgi:hypothetical protein
MSRLTRLLGMSELPSLHEWAGGDTAFSRLINAFYDRVENPGADLDYQAPVLHWGWGVTPPYVPSE